MNPEHFRRYVIRPTLAQIGLYSVAAENLLLGTALVESNLQWLRQIGGGPAVGVYQIEPATHDDCLRYLGIRRDLGVKVERLVADRPDTTTQLATNLAYATAIARIKYYMIPLRLPDPDDVAGLARYWKTYYNTHLGAGRVEHFEARYKPAHEV